MWGYPPPYGGKIRLNREERKQTLLGYLFLAPSLAVFTMFMFYPLLYTIYLSFFKQDVAKPIKRFVELASYTTILRDPNPWKIAGNTAVYILVLLVLSFVPPYILSFVLSTVIKRGQGFHKAALFLSSVVSPVVGSILYIWILSPISGPVALVLKYFGLALPFQSKAGGWVIAVPNIITPRKVFGYNLIIMLAGMFGVSQGVIEAARLDDIPLWKIFRDMAVPVSSVTGIYVFITTVVQGLQYVFISIRVVTQGGPDHTSSNLVYMSYREVFALYRAGTSSAISVIIMVLSIVLLLPEFRSVEKRIYYEN